MFPAPMPSPRTLTWRGLLAITTLAAPAFAQVPPDALQRLHTEIVQQHQAVGVAAARDALHQLAQWAAQPGDLSPEQQHAWYAIQIHANLAIGDLAAARAALDQLRQAAPAADATRQAAYLVATAAGDADKAEEALKQLSAGASREERSALSIRRRWMSRVGKPAPETPIETAGGEQLDPHQRGGKLLIVDFWNTTDTTTDYAAAVRALFEAYRRVDQVQFVGVNKDDDARRDAAQAFADKAKFDWPQHFEGVSRGSPLTDRAFRAGSPPWTLLIDGNGQVRAVGDVRTPGWRYALRSALVEAGGSLPETEAASPPETTSPQQEAAADEDQTQSGDKPAAAPRVPKTELPSNDEAEALLRQARTYIRTGMKTKARELLERIIREYPGTRQAADAQERLNYL